MVLFYISFDIDIDEPENTKITLVLPTGKMKVDKVITSTNKDSEKNITKIKDELYEDHPTYKNVNDQLNDLKDWVSDNFYPATGGDVDLSDYAKNADVDTKLNDLKDWTDTNYQSKTDLSEYAKIVDVNNAFNELATALGGL